jgi:L-rhamnose 1-dehydrogenase
MGKTMNVNFNGAFLSCQAAAQQMSTQQPPSGSIIAISSISALVGGGMQTHYTPTKAAVLSLTQSMAIALGKYKIRSNALLPGTVFTQLSEDELKADPEKKAYLEERIPLGRIGNPEDIAGPAVFLACDELSGYVNGAQLLVDGGLYVHLQ